MTQVIVIEKAEFLAILDRRFDLAIQRNIQLLSHPEQAPGEAGQPIAKKTAKHSKIVSDGKPV